MAFRHAVGIGFNTQLYSARGPSIIEKTFTSRLLASVWKQLRSLDHAKCSNPTLAPVQQQLRECSGLSSRQTIANSTAQKTEVAPSRSRQYPDEPRVITLSQGLLPKLHRAACMPHA